MCFTLEDGTEVEARGDQQIEYDGEMHTAANLFDALKEGYYGKFLNMQHIKIDKKIAKYRVQKPDATPAPAAAPAAAKDAVKTQDNVIWMHEKLERPEVLIGSDVQDKDAGVRSRHVRHHQRHSAQ